MLTELDIINDMLAASGFRALTANDYRHPSYAKAKNKLDIVSSDIQNYGYWFNTSEVDLKLSTEGYIYVPTNTITCDPVDITVKSVVRGNRLYNFGTSNFIFPAALRARLIERVSIEDLPNCAKQAILHAARYFMYLDQDGTATKLEQFEKHYHTALMKLNREDIRQRDVNYFKGINFRRRLRTARNPVTYGMV